MPEGKYYCSQECKQPGKKAKKETVAEHLLDRKQEYSRALLYYLQHILLPFHWIWHENWLVHQPDPKKALFSILVRIVYIWTNLVPMERYWPVEHGSIGCKILKSVRDHGNGPWGQWPQKTFKLLWLTSLTAAYVKTALVSTFLRRSIPSLAQWHTIPWSPKVTYRYWSKVIGVTLKWPWIDSKFRDICFCQYNWQVTHKRSYFHSSFKIINSYVVPLTSTMYIWYALHIMQHALILYVRPSPW